MYEESSTVNKPLVTIGITAFNAQDSIKRAIFSALEQDWHPLEILIVDDQSKDNTVAIVQELIKDIPKAQLFIMPQNSGVAAARNFIIQNASGEFLAFFDDDDVSQSCRISRQVQRITDYEQSIKPLGPVICHSARELQYENGVKHIAPTMGEQTKQAPNGIKVAERILLGFPLQDGYGACPTCSQMARLQTYQELGGFDPVFRRSEDTELNIRLSKAGGHFVGIAAPLVTQIMTKGSDKGLQTELYYATMMLEKHRDVADQYNLYNFCHQWLVVKHAWLAGDTFSFLSKLLRLVFTYPRSVFMRLGSAFQNRRLNKAYGQFHENT